LRNRFGNPQCQYMPVGAGYFDTGNNFKRVVMLLAVGPQARFETVMIGDSDNIQVTALGNVIQHLAHSGVSVTDGGMNVQVSSSCQVFHMTLTLSIHRQIYVNVSRVGVRTRDFGVTNCEKRMIFV
jgi:hypothetical protein